VQHHPPAPFVVMDCTLLIEALGRSAQTLRELRDHIGSVPRQSIAHHFHETLLRAAFDDPEYRNDFALWARRQLHDVVLAERLAVLDPIDFKDLEQLRQYLLEVIEDRLGELHHVPQVERGREFHFLRSRFVVFDTGIRAETPAGLAASMRHMSTGSVFYHFVEARRRPPLRMDDFSAWLENWGPKCVHVREELAAIDFQLWTLSELRQRIARSLAACRESQEGADGQA
jgi:hypothetical protein